MVGLRHVSSLRVTVEIDLTISGAAVVHYNGKADSGFVMHAQTLEGLDLIGMLPTETMAHLQDQIEAAAQIDETALLNARATLSSPVSPADKTSAKGAVAQFRAALSRLSPDPQKQAK